MIEAVSVGETLEEVDAVFDDVTLVVRVIERVTEGLRVMDTVPE